MIKPPSSDTQYIESTISDVRTESDGYSVTTHSYGTLFVEKKRGVRLVPKPGMVLRTYGRGFGYTVRGIVIDGTVFRYRTEKQEESRFKKMVRDDKAKRYREFRKNKKSLMKRVKALPEPLQKRFVRFEAANPDFWPMYGGYELFVCEEAVKIAKAFAERPPGDLAIWYAASGFTDKATEVPDLSDDHSGNTFSMATRLATLMLTDPEMASGEHGALVALVGCETYGCGPHKTQET